MGKVKVYFIKGDWVEVNYDIEWLAEKNKKEVLEIIDTWLEDEEIGGELILRVVEMTEKKFNKMPIIDP